MYAGHWAQWSGPVIVLGVAATDGAGVAGGRVGIAALLALTLVTGALVAPELLQPARKAPTPARAVPLRKRRRLITGETGSRSKAVNGSPSRGQAHASRLRRHGSRMCARAARTRAPRRPGGRGSPDSSVRHSACLLYTSPSPRDGLLSRMPS